MTVSHDTVSLFKAHCKATKQWGLFLSFHIDSPDELLLACPYAEELPLQARFDGYAFIFGTKEEVEERYGQTVGDDGPTKTNSYDGPVHVYALTCDDKGQAMNENT